MMDKRASDKVEGFQNPRFQISEDSAKSRSLTDIREKRGWVRDDSPSSCGVRAQRRAMERHREPYPSVQSGGWGTRAEPTPRAAKNRVFAGG